MIFLHEKINLVFPLFLLTNTLVFSQDSIQTAASLSLVTDISIPIGNFGETHLLGVSAQVEKVFKNKQTHSSGLMPMTAAGVIFFFGKDEKQFGEQYRYPAFLLLHAMGGVKYFPSDRIALKVLGGPATGLYNGLLSFHLVANLQAIHQFGDRFSAGLIFRWMKKSGTESLMAPGILASFDLR